ncbi:hypothetical protein [Plantibacter sp. Leaf314]|uniref:hypothetical protein n=1 Tax=Plantibacter sp. Leaf314 TaxID=1736333 RepID=UPI000A69905B|nr:hypothetical protein [Plantibacter sp. Leaf314]
MTNPLLDQERVNFLAARQVLATAPLPAWPRTSKQLNLVELEVDWVKFSTLNHRTRAEQRAVVALQGDTTLFSADPFGFAAQEAQYEILRTQEGFAELRSDLANREQQEPAIVTADGVLINGNRRAAALRSLYIDEDRPDARYIRCLVLPADATVAELVDLETELQIARDFKQEYGWINEALLVEELYERESRDYSRVATRMHKDVSAVRSLHEKLQQVHQLVSMSSGSRNYIDFNDNESAFDELAKHVRNKQPIEAESVRSVYFLGTLANVKYRKLRHLRRPDAAELVKAEIESDPSLSKLLALAEETDRIGGEAQDVLDAILGEAPAAGPLTALLGLVATRRVDEAVELEGGTVVEMAAVLESLASAVVAAADEAEEDQRDQSAQVAPLARLDKAIVEVERATEGLARARAFDDFDETGLASRITRLQALLGNFAETQS